MKEASTSPKTTSTHNDTVQKFPIVAIGSSAGGLEAMESFFKNTPGDLGMAFIVVAHLSPDHTSILPDLLQRITPMNVYLIENGTKVYPNNVYVIPPNKDLSISNGILELNSIETTIIPHLPIDIFFASLATDQGEQAIAIILSGTGTDGTLGIKEIKSKLGMAIVQSQESAQYDGMPSSAISTGLVDFILPPDKIPQQLNKYTTFIRKKVTTDIELDISNNQTDLTKILQLVYFHTGHDFSFYKKNTIYRRIERRMSFQQLDKLHEYLRYLEKSKREIEILFNELLIGVTNFFRDPKAFELIKDKILPELLNNLNSNNSFRIWVAGCSTGEEAYSYAIILHEVLQKLGKQIDVQIFATDIDKKAIEIARNGLYPSNIVSDVNKERLKNYFNKENSFFRIKKIIREMIIFAPQNLIKDPPFTKIDLISCRNVLIYFSSKLQNKLLPLFSYSLNENGVLVLGPSETIGKHTDLFKIINKKWKIFTNCNNKNNTNRLIEFTGTVPMFESPNQNEKIPKNEMSELSSSQLIETVLQQSPTPASVIITDSGNIVYIHGKTGNYLELAEGKLSTNIVDIARPGLKKELTQAIQNVSIDKSELTFKKLKVYRDKDYKLVNLTVKALIDQPALRGMMIVIFSEDIQQNSNDTKSKSKLKENQNKSKTVLELELELKNVRENLQTTIEELETSNEDLRSTNEELQSTNEELQSTNEELETSKEELQSLNEESSTMNEELQSRIDDLCKSNDDIKNFLNSTDIATIFLDMDLNIRRFTNKATDIIPLTFTDIGRPISHLAINLKNKDLVEDSKKVLDNLEKIECTVKSLSGIDYLMKIQPYRTTSNLIDGVVITFVDISNFVRVSDALKVSEAAIRFGKNVINTIREPFLILNSNLEIILANTSFYRYFKTNKRSIIGFNLFNIGNNEWDIPELKKLLQQTLKVNLTFNNFKVTNSFPNIGEQTILLNARKIVNTEAEEDLILLAFEYKNNNEIH